MQPKVYQRVSVTYALVLLGNSRLNASFTRRLPFAPASTGTHTVSKPSSTRTHPSSSRLRVTERSFLKVLKVMDCRPLSAVALNSFACAYFMGMSFMTTSLQESGPTRL